MPLTEQQRSWLKSMNLHSPNLHNPGGGGPGAPGGGAGYPTYDPQASARKKDEDKKDRDRRAAIDRSRAPVQAADGTLRQTAGTVPLQTEMRPVQAGPAATAETPPPNRPAPIAPPARMPPAVTQSGAADTATTRVRPAPAGVTLPQPPDLLRNRVGSSDYLVRLEMARKDGTPIIVRGQTVSAEAGFKAVQGNLLRIVHSLRNLNSACGKINDDFRAQGLSGKASTAVQGIDLAAAVKAIGSGVDKVEGQLGAAQGNLGAGKLAAGYMELMGAWGDFGLVSGQVDRCAKALDVGAGQIVDGLRAVQSGCTTALSILVTVTPVGALGRIAVALAPAALKVAERASGNDEVTWDEVLKDVLAAFVFEKLGKLLSSRLTGRLLKTLQAARKDLPPDAVQTLCDELLGVAGTWIEAAVGKASEAVYDAYVSKKPKKTFAELGEEVIEEAINSLMKDRMGEILKEAGAAAPAAAKSA